MNFYYCNFNIYDNKTTMPAIGFGAIKPNKNNYIGATNGVVMNITIVNAHYGYGLIQSQAARNVKFYNLHGIGGITLRLETGSSSMNKTQFGGNYDIIGQNISIANGHAAVLCGPHGIKNGICHFKDITAKSSGTAFQLGDGGNGKDGKGCGGYFSDGTSVENVTAIFGINAQIKTKELYKIPEEYISIIGKPGNKGIIENSPSHSCVCIQSKREIIYDKSTFKAIGFKYGNPIIISKNKISNEDLQKKRMNYIKNKYKTQQN